MTTHSLRHYLRSGSRALIILFCCWGLTGCVGTVVGAVVDTAIEVVKVPFKVGGAVIDAVTPDKLTDSDSDQPVKKTDEDAAVHSESDGI